MEITAVIPVRQGSKRVPNKNIRPFAGSSLLVEKIRQLHKVTRINHVLVSSDSKEMLEVARQEGCLVQPRPAEYCDEQTKTFNEVCQYVAQHAPGDLLIWAPCVCPNCDEKSFDRGLDDYFAHVDNGPFDSVVSCRLFKEYLFNEKGPMNYVTEKHVKSQDLPDWKVIVNGFYIASRDLMIQRRYFYGVKPYLSVLSKNEALDIDDTLDFEFAEFLYRKKQQGEL